MSQNAIIEINESQAIEIFCFDRDSLTQIFLFIRKSFVNHFVISKIQIAIITYQFYFTVLTTVLKQYLSLLHSNGNDADKEIINKNVYTKLSYNFVITDNLLMTYNLVKL